MFFKLDNDSLMNQSNLYSYSILVRVWNDLDMNVLLIVKEYLEVHLNRRLLISEDYNMFINKIKKIVRERKNDCNYSGHLIKTRYGLKNIYGDFDYRRMCFQPYQIDWNIKPKFYIAGIEIISRNFEIHYEWGFDNNSREKFLKTYEEKYHPLEKNILIDKCNLIQYKSLFLGIIKNLMIEEENGICPYKD